MTWALRTFLTIAAIAFPIIVYVSLRTAGSVGVLRPALKARARRTALGALVWLFILPLTLFIIRLSGGGSAFAGSDGLPDWVNALFLLPFWVALIAVVELLGPFLLAEIVALVTRFTPSLRQQARRALAVARLGLAVLAFIYVPVRTVSDTAHVRTTEERVRLEHLPPELEGLRLALVGDVQVDQFTGTGKIGQMHAIVAQAGPQLLLSAGDVVTSGTNYLDEAAEAMCGMKGSVASIAVMGDHDFWSAAAAVRKMHTACGWEFLENRHLLIPYRGRSILISGLTHIYAERLNDRELDLFFAEAPPADVRILLAHQPAPRVVRHAARHRYDLYLAGHTHGGQIVFHPFGLPLTPSMREGPYYSGIHRVGSLQVVVTNGVGLTLAPVRYHAPAEITVINLSRKQ